jgi:hypothetical protein
MPGNTRVSTRNKRAQEKPPPVAKIIPQMLFLFFSENGKSRKRVTMTAANFRRQTPNAAATNAQLGKFLFRKFQNAVGRVRANSMDRMRRAITQPIKTIRLLQMIHGDNFNYRRKTIKRKFCIN